MRVRNQIVCIVVLCLLLVGGCSSALSEGEAEEKALEFVRSQGMFYTRAGDDVSDVPDYRLAVQSGEERYENWVFVIEVSGLVNGTVKRAELTVGVDLRTGTVRLLSSS